MNFSDQDLKTIIMENVPSDGSAIGNIKLRNTIEKENHTSFEKTDFERIRDQLIEEGILVSGGGRGGSVKLASPDSSEKKTLQLEKESQVNPIPLKREKTRKKSTGPRAVKSDQKEVISYRYSDKRKNNPHVGMVDTASDGVEEHTVWGYDPHIDPTLQFDMGRASVEKLIDDALASQDPEVMKQALAQLKRMQEPYLNWTGKAERTAFEVDLVSLHVHERIDPATILSALQKQIKDRKGNKLKGKHVQTELFSAPFENLPLRDAIDFYKHEKNWANRLVAGDSLMVMNSLIQKESMAGQVQMIYIDPPYGIKYGSNFQPFVNKRDVKDRKDEDLTQEPEMIKAFRDTWELGLHSYLTYLRDRLMLSKELLHESGSVFVQISDENLHMVRNILDEVFGTNNFVSQISFQKTGSISGNLLSTTVDYLLWYAKDKIKIKYRQLFLNRTAGETSLDRYNKILQKDLNSISLTAKEIRGESTIPEGFRYRVQSLFSDGSGKEENRQFIWNGSIFSCPSTGHWKTTNYGLKVLCESGRLEQEGKKLRYRRFVDDFPVLPIHDRWESIQIGTKLTYVVQTAEKVIERCLLMTTDPGDLVLDPTCGSGTTAFVAEKWGRRWITCDTSRVAVTLAKQRLMTASFDYYDLKYPHEGIKGGFIYKTVPHITLKAIANNPEIDEIYGRMHPAIDDALDQLNAALSGHETPFKVTEGCRKGKTIEFTKSPSETMTLPSGETVSVSTLFEWEVPFDFPDDWPEAAQKPFDDFHAARQTMQKAMDATIAAHADQEILYDQPQVSKTKLRITGPFTVEAVPFPTVLRLEEADQPDNADVAVARSGETARQTLWRDELLKTGIRGKGGQKLMLADLETLPDCRYIHAVGIVAESGDRVAVSFGPEHAALEQRQVEIAMREAGELFPLPKMLVFCAFTFDPEAAKDIDKIKGITAIKAQMNTDLLTDDLKKKRANNESFWLMGQPDVEILKLDDGQFQVAVHGFDYFDTKTGELVSGGTHNIAMWELDSDYDDRSLFARQVFFPMAGKQDGWNKLKKNIKAELDDDRMEQFHGTISLPFESGDNKRIAVKIIDDRGIESLKVMNLE